MHPGEKVTLMFTFPGGGGCEGALFFAERGFEFKEGPAPPYSLSIVVPADRLGRLELQAATFGRS